MAKNSRKRIGAAGAVLALAISGSAGAAGLPLRATGPAQDRALAALAEGLDFKLSRLGAGGFSTWSAMVDETLLVARRLGCPAGMPVTAQHVGKVFAVVLEGESTIAGSNPDEVLGRLLYLLAHADPAGSTPASLAVLDQPLSATLTALPLISLP